MPASNPLFLADPRIQKLIKNKSRAMVGHYGFTWADQDDIEQELRIDLLKRSKSYDPSKASIATFCDRLITHRLADLIAERQAECRDWRKIVHFSDQITTADSETRTLEDILASEAEEIADAEQKMDIQSFLVRLKPELRKFCIRLLDESIAEISSTDGVPASTLYDLRNRLRSHLKKFAKDSQTRPRKF